MHCELILSAILLVAIQPPAAPEKTADLQLQYARAKLQLAEANLKRVEQINRRLAGTISAATVAELHNDVVEARQQVASAESAPEGGEFGVWLRRAQSNLETATTQWKNAVAANQRLQSTRNATRIFDPLDVERFRLRAEVCRLQWERGETLAAAPRETQLQWQIELLNNEVDRLKEDAARSSPFIRYYPIYWFPY